MTRVEPKYNVKIIRRLSDYVDDDWHATVTRKSDGREVVYTARWMFWMRVRISRWCLDRSFKRTDRRRAVSNRFHEYEV